MGKPIPGRGNYIKQGYWRRAKLLLIVDSQRYYIAARFFEFHFYLLLTNDGFETNGIINILQNRFSFFCVAIVGKKPAIGAGYYLHFVHFHPGHFGAINKKTTTRSIGDEKSNPVETILFIFYIQICDQFAFKNKFVGGFFFAGINIFFPIAFYNAVFLFCFL